MPGPWEDYQKPAAAAKSEAPGPWSDYAPKNTPPRTEIEGPDLKKIGNNIVNFVSGDGGQLGEGIPVLGPAARKAGEYFRAGIDSVAGGKPFGETLAGIQKENQTRQEKFANENPGTDVARKVVGAIGGAGAVPVIGANLPGISGGLARIASTTALGAGDIALRGGSAEDVKRAATFGGGAQAAMEAVPVVGRVAKPLTGPLAEAVESLGAKVADTGAARAAKSMLGNLKSNYKSFGSENRVIAAGKRALEEGVVKFGSAAGAMGRRAENAAKNAWSKVEETFVAADSAGVKVDGKDIAAQIRADAAKIKDVPKNESRISDLEKEAAYYESKGPMSLREAQDYKGNYDWKTVDKQKDVLGKNGNNLVNRAIGNAIKDKVKVSGLPNSENFESVYQDSGAFGSLAKGAKATSEQQSRNRSPFSLTDYLVGGAGGTAAAVLTGNKEDAGVAGLAIATANNLARTRGNSALAVSLNRLGQVIASKPEQLGKFYGVLERAAVGGQASLAATHAALLKDEPAYRKALEPEQQPDKPNGMPIVEPSSGPVERRIRRTGE